MFEKVRRDLWRACQMNQGGSHSVFALLRELFNPGTQAILLHRLGFWCDRLPIPLVRELLKALHFLLQYVFSWRVGIFIPVKAEIEPGIVIHTWGGGVFLPCCRIGRDVTVVGGGVLFDYLTKEIGDEVIIGAGVKSVGKIVIGNRVRIAPNTLIMQDVPDDSLVSGSPSRVLSGVRLRLQGSKKTT
ncbi:MAG: serine O-acetyltransferase [Gemmatimonadales bacterium]